MLSFYKNKDIFSKSVLLSKIIMNASYLRKNKDLVPLPSKFKNDSILFFARNKNRYNITIILQV